MNNNITINIVEPGTPPSPTPIDPGTGIDPAVPDTGLFTHGIGSTEAAIIAIISIVLLLTISSIVIAILYRKHKKQNKTTKLVHIVDSTKAVITNKKRITTALTALALLISAGTFIALTKNGANASDNDTQDNQTGQVDETSEGEGTEDGLTIDVSNNELTIEVGDEPVFAVLPVEITVEQATEAGYTLTAYTDNTDLVSTTDSSNTIPMIAVEGDELAKLTNNTYGLALTEPESKDNEIYTTLSTDQDNPTLITDKDYEATEANDTTTIYYGFYITPDVLYGAYEGGNISYDAEENPIPATVVFDGNGLTFDDGETTNVMRYIPGKQSAPQYSHTPNINDEGVQNGKYGTNLNETFVYDFPGYEKTYINIVKAGGDTPWAPEGDYFSIWPGEHENYTAKDDWDSDDSIKEFGSNGKYNFISSYDSKGIVVNNSSITLAYTTDSNSGCCGGKGYGYYATVMGYVPNSNVAGVYVDPSLTVPYRFLGWSMDKDATSASFVTEEDIIRGLDLTKGGVTLYAVWQKGIEINYDGNGADSTINMNDVKQSGYAFDLVSANLRVDLLAPNFKRDGYGFVGWSADAEAWDHLTDDNEGNDPTIYGPNQTITLDEDLIAEAGETRKLILNAVWVPAETTASGDPVELQSWQGCSSLTATTYDAETGTLSVGKNTITALTDNRDGEVYSIARLADGNCWMMENLRLDDGAIITTQNTNNPFTTDGNVAIKNNDGTVVNHLSPTYSEWCDAGTEQCINQSYLETSNTALTTVSPVFEQDFTVNPHDSSLNDNIYSYGNYYNWYSATMGNGTTDIDRDENARGDICPAGWRLPVGRNYDYSGSFLYLNQQMSNGYGAIGSNDWRSFPNNFIYSGNYHRTSISERGLTGYFSSATADTSYSNTVLRFYDESLSPGTYDITKYDGFPVRCVAPVE